MWCRLGDLCDYGICNNVHLSEIPDNAWVLDLEDIEKDTAKLLQRVIKTDRITTSVRHSFAVGNVLYSKLRTYLNKVLVADIDGFCTTEMLPLDFKGFVIPEYARHVLMSQMFLDYTAQCGYGVKMPRLGTTDGKKALFPLPPLAEQKRIVCVIESAFTLIEEIESNKSSLTQFIKHTKSKVLDLAIRGKLVPQDPNDEPASMLLEKIGNEQKTKKNSCDNLHYDDNEFELPNNWQITTMQNVCFLFDGEKIDGKELPYLDVKYLRGKSEAKIMSFGRFVPKNSTMILVDGENSGELFSVMEDGYQGSTFKILNISEFVDKDFIFKILQKEQSTFRESKVGSAIPHLDKKLFRELPVFLPPLAEQKRIVQKIESIFQTLDLIQDNL